MLNRCKLLIMCLKENKERLKKLVAFAVSKGIATSQKDFGRFLGYDNESSFSQILNKMPMSVDLATKIKEALPELNLAWIINGEGDMLMPSSGISAPVQMGVDINANSTINKALDEIAAQRRMNETLQAKLCDLVDKMIEKM